MWGGGGEGGGGDGGGGEGEGGGGESGGGEGSGGEGGGGEGNGGDCGGGGGGGAVAAETEVVAAWVGSPSGVRFEHAPRTIHISGGALGSECRALCSSIFSFTKASSTVCARGGQSHQGASVSE